MNAVALNGERTLISRSAGTVRPTGIHNHPGVPTFVPHIPIGMLVVPKTDFLKLVIGERFRISTMRLGRLDRDRVSDADLAGAITGSGTQIKATDFRRLASLHDAGPGRYLVEIGGGFARGADGQPFVLDLSGKVQ